ncbi:hypothetical protein [Burkholderia mallei]|uniref:hypothetical protein n=1 Tax=Burkholderia mallei TaxID=13373 RepID=UPI000A97B99D|nr:hypothetical protein [Burkholderia mallei]
MLEAHWPYRRGAGQPLANALGADRPVIGLQYLGLDGKHAPHASVEATAAHYVRSDC